MEKLLIINTQYKQYGGEDSNIEEEIKFYKKFYNIEYFKIENSNFNVFSIITLLIQKNFQSDHKLSLILKEFKPRHVYIHNTWFNAGLGIFDKLSQKKIVPLVKIHNFRFECGRYFLLKNHIKSGQICAMCAKDKKSNLFFNKYYENSYIKSFFLILYSKKYFNILRKSNIKIICLNIFQKNFLIKLGISESKIHILENPISVPTSTPTYNHKSNYVIYAGTLDNDKGVYELCNAWRKFNNGAISLYIIGTGPLQDTLKDQFASDDIEFHGFLSNKKTIELIKRAKAVITATKMYEVQPRLLNEASINSIPSIYPSFGGMDEYFPKDYEMSFEQYNYESLLKKLEVLNNTNKLQESSSQAYSFLIEKLSTNSIRKKFEIISNN
jgi:glycosyltransferase involved in cell wall biosynthesis